MTKSSSVLGLRVGMVVSLEMETGDREIACCYASGDQDVATFQVIRPGRDRMNKVLLRCVAWRRVDCIEIDTENVGLHGLLETFFAKPSSRRWQNHLLAESYIDVSDLGTGIGLLSDMDECIAELPDECFLRGERVNWERLKTWNAPHVPPSIRYNQVIVKALVAKHGFARTTCTILAAVERLRNKSIFSESGSSLAPRVDDIDEGYRLSLRWDSVLVCLLWERLMLLAPGEDDYQELGDAVSEILAKALMIDIEFSDVTPTTDLTHWMSLTPPTYLADGYEDRLYQRIGRVFRDMEWERLAFPLIMAWWSEDVSHVPWLDRLYPILCDRIVDRCIDEAWDCGRFEDVLTSAYAEGNFSAYNPFYRRFIPVFDRLTVSMQAAVGLGAIHHLKGDEQSQVHRLIRQHLETEGKGPLLAEAMAKVIVEHYCYKKEEVLFQIGEHFPNNPEQLTELITALLSAKERG